jgi:hypothetical protein
MNAFDGELILMTCFVHVSGGHGLDVWKPITHEGSSLPFTPRSVQDGAAGGDLQFRNSQKGSYSGKE